MSKPQFAGASIDITPPVGAPMGGYAQRGRKPASGRHDPLMADVLWLRTSLLADVVWVTLDALAVDSELSTEISEELCATLGCELSSVIVCGSHTHSGPAGWTGDMHPAARTGADDTLKSALIDKIVAGTSGLETRLQSVDLLYFETAAPGVGSNRNDPLGPHDDSLGLLAFVDDGGRVAAMLFDHASHPTVLGENNLQWSADWPGAAKRVLRSALATVSPFPGKSVVSRRTPVVGFLQGAAGDISARYVRRDQSFAEADRLGTLCAAHAFRGLADRDPVELTREQLVMTHATVRLPLGSLSDPDTAMKTANEMKLRWDEVRAGSGSPAEQRIALTRYEGAEIRARMTGGDLPSEFELPLTAVGLGPCAWIHLPVELFASLGLRIRRSSPFEYTRVVGYAENYFGYVADEPAHENLVYEAMASVFDAHAGEELIDAAVDLLVRTKESMS